MNVVMKIYQENTFKTIIYGYVNLDLQYLPHGVEITDWFPIVAYSPQHIGMGKVSISFSVKNVNDKELTPININCISKLNKMWYPNTKAINNAFKNEQENGTKFKRIRTPLMDFDYNMYSPFQLKPKHKYIKDSI
ncbi:hypothetical protein QTN25_009114 [Entamoeba marina]